MLTREFCEVCLRRPTNELRDLVPPYGLVAAPPPCDLCGNPLSAVNPKHPVDPENKRFQIAFCYGQSNPLCWIEAMVAVV